MSSRNSHSHFYSSPPPLSSSFQEAPYIQGNGDAPRKDAAAAVAAAGLLDEYNAHQHSALNLDSPPSPKVTSAETPAGSTTVSTPKRERAGTLSSNLGQIQFRSHTIAPSPTLPRFTSDSTPPRPSATVDSNLHSSPRGRQNLNSPTGHRLRLQTEINPIVNPFTTATGDSLSFGTLSSSPTPIRSSRPSLTLHRKSSTSSLRPISRTPSLRAGSLPNPFSPISATSSCYPSPVISAMGDVTPLPSPLLPNDSPGPWKRLGNQQARDTIPESHPVENAPFANTESSSPTPAMVLPKKKSYAGLQSGRTGAANDTEHLRTQTTSASHSRNRSISEYIPDPMHIPKRMSTISGTRVRPELKNVEPGYDGHMRREPHLSGARGLAPTIEKPPTPPPSEASLSANDVSSLAAFGLPNKESHYEYFEAYGKHDRKLRRWRAIKMLGQGTFSRVMLATSQISPSDDEDCSPGTDMHTPEPTYHHDRRSLVAVKVCEHGPRGGASEDRIEMSLKRELELMRVLHHPSLVQLKAWNIEMTRAILVLSYCPGGDLFDIASRHRDMLSPALTRRIFSEVVGAVSYLHSEKIVHRDIKLENVLVNLAPEELSTPTDWATYPYSVITLTDLGLSRRVADDEKLETRCGSDDYAAPEVIMGQPYDGRATDAWSLGVLLYALLEGRLPFDPPPGAGDYAMQMRMRSRTSHRIARVEWRWIEYGVPNGVDGEGKHEADPAKFSAKGLQGARDVVEGLLRRARTRWPLTQAAATEWVSGGIQVEGGIRFREEDDGEEVSQ
ncbi:kinase-like domain-containing protein [Pseudoneurospora amorphoporcata]|uniref:Kinase-like domain-containing protein n=1 Tax=Pseudoneurospora amorphoporcata TaxID=241081 RepID=A0AAN6NU80_9PEZI|nr:kinase-like domain-containing protein [Pseudoneurospora amorphoporcata]